jgi:hypothetical protein
MRVATGGIGESSALRVVMILSLAVGSFTFRTGDEQGGAGESLLASLEQQAALKAVTARGPRNATQSAAFSGLPVGKPGKSAPHCRFRPCSTFSVPGWSELVSKYAAV